MPMTTRETIVKELHDMHKRALELSQKIRKDGFPGLSEEMIAYASKSLELGNRLDFVNSVFKLKEEQ